MNLEQLYNLVQGLLPGSLQFVDPYLDQFPIPKGDWLQMNVIEIRDDGWGQARQIGFNSATNEVDKAIDTQRIYVIQFDCYGLNAFQNASYVKQKLQYALRQQKNVGYRLMTDIENLTWLQDSKLFKRRYGFKLEIYIVDTITETSATFNKVRLKTIQLQ